MDQSKSKKSYIIMLDREIVPALKGFLLRHRDVKVVAIDRLVADRLSRNNIDNICAYDLIGRSEESGLFASSMSDIYLSLNSQPLREKGIDPDYIYFFDSTKFDIWRRLQKAYYFQRYFSLLWSKLQPEMVYYFGYRGNIICRYLENSLEVENMPHKKEPLGMICISLIKLSHAYLFSNEWLFKGIIRLTDYKTYSVSSSLIKKKYASHNELVVKTLKEGNNAALVFLRSKRELLKLIELLLAFKNVGRAPIVIVPKSFGIRELQLLDRNKIKYLYFYIDKKSLVSMNSAEFGRFEEIICDKLLPRHLFSSIFSSWFIKALNFKRKYRFYSATWKIFDNFFFKIRPEIFLDANIFFNFSLIGNMIAEKYGTKRVSLISEYAERHHYHMLVPQNSAYLAADSFKARGVFVSGEHFISGLNSILPANGIGIFNPYLSYANGVQDIDAQASLRQPILNKLGLPQAAKIIVYAGQPHKYNIAFMNEIASCFCELSAEGQPLEGYYLILRPHPFEMKAWYQLACRFRKSNIVATRDGGLMDLLSVCEFMICHESFTAVEAMSIGKRVLLLDWLRLPERSGFFDLPLVTKIDKLEELSEALIGLAKSARAIPSGFKEQFNEFFSSSGMTAEEAAIKIINC